MGKTVAIAATRDAGAGIGGKTDGPGWLSGGAVTTIGESDSYFGGGYKKGRERKGDEGEAGGEGSDSNPVPHKVKSTVRQRQPMADLTLPIIWMRQTQLPQQYVKRAERQAVEEPEIGNVLQIDAFKQSQ